VARPTDDAEYPCDKLPMRWMAWFSTKALSHLRESQELKLEKLKCKALVNGRSGEKKSVTINKR
jgi:hypothetical protein